MTRRFVSLFTFTVFVLPLGLLVAQGLADAQAPDADLPEGVVARIKLRDGDGGSVVTAEEVLARLNELEEALPVGEQRLRQAYQFLINLNLLRAEARRLGVTVSADERRKLADDQIQEYRSRVKRDYGDALTWERFLAEKGLKEEALRARIEGRAEQILLRRRIVNFFELTTPSVSYVQIRVHREADASGILAKLDVLRADADKGKTGEDGKPIVFEDEFKRIAVLQSTFGKQTMKSAFREQGLPDVVEKALFETLTPGRYSGVLKAGDNDFRIVYLQRRSEGEKLSYAETKPRLDLVGDVDDGRYTRWAAVLFNSGRYEAMYRIPGETNARERPPLTESE